MPRSIDRTSLSTLIRPDEVITSADLLSRLRAETGASEVAARQIVKRNHAKDGIWRSEKLKLPQNERLFARTRFVGTVPFLRQVAARLQHLRPGVARCLQRTADGVALHRATVIKMLAAPLVQKPRAGRPAVEAELEALAEVGVVRGRAGTDFECFMTLPAAGGAKADNLAVQAHRAMRIELLLARILCEYLRRMNIVSWGRVEVGNPEMGYVDFNNHAFTAKGWTYLSPVVKWKGGDKPTGCPVVIDVQADRCTLADVHSFQDRLAKAAHHVEPPLRLLGVLAARDFELSALKEARRTGLFIVNFKQLYGERALEALRTVSELLNLGTDVDRQLELGLPSFGKMLEDLKANPVVVRIRSIAFEAVTALVLQEQHGCSGVRLGLNVPFRDSQTGVEVTRDVDVHGRLGDVLWVVECKAYHEAKEVDLSEVNRFYNQVVPAVLDYARQHEWEIRECRAEFWTTGRFADDCRPSSGSSPLRRSGVSVLPRLLDGEQVQREIPYSLGRRCGELLKAIAMHEAPDDEE